MTLKQLVTNMPVKAGYELDLGHIQDLEKFKKAVIAVMNTAGVATGRGTHYNSGEQELQARLDAGKALFTMDRGVFLLVHALDGVTDHARQTAVKAMLMNNWERYACSSLNRDIEMRGIRRLVETLPANRALNLFNELRADRVNNSRTKKRLILTFLLNHPNLEWWAVKYRRKVRKALEHAWGKQAAGVIKAIIHGNPTPLEQKGLHTRIDKYLEQRTDRRKVYECMAFVLGGATDFTSPLFQAFKAAKKDIAQGAMLPLEVLEGIRSTYHKTVSQKQMLELTKDTSLTEKKKALIQRKARKENIAVAFNPMARTAVELYILAYAEGMTDMIRQALMKKARQGAKALPVKFGKIGILVDNSFSMIGRETQKLRPMAIALSMKDVLANIGDMHVVKTTSGRPINTANPLPKPVGSTDLSSALVDLLENGVEAVFILTDGYENTPSGRIDEVMQLLERIGNSTPMYQLSPVIASESRVGLKTLSDSIPVIPAGNPQALALTLVRAMIEVDIQRGIQALASLALPRLNINTIE
ncbi:MAG: VWA domain-containing protein [bacterium]|nr:VWA domain-containing protein [bacterium]